MATPSNGDVGNQRTGVLHFLTPPAKLEAMREPAAGADLMKRHLLDRYESESRRTLRRGISHFLSPQLRVLIKEKPRIALSEKAEFAELLSEPSSGRPIQELSVDLMRRSFMIRRRVETGADAVKDDETAGRPPVPPDVPMEEQTTNHMSPAYYKKGTSARDVLRSSFRHLGTNLNVSRRSSPSGTANENCGDLNRFEKTNSATKAGEVMKKAKRPRPAEDEGSRTPPPPDVKSVVKPLILKLMAMKWPGWGNPFSVIIRKSNAPPGYFDIVKRPMNLIYIRDNLNRKQYSTVRKVEEDLDLLVNNALAFNRQSDPVYQQALELQSVYRAELPHLKNILEREQARAKRGPDTDGQLDKKARMR